MAAIPFPTDAWIKALMEEINKSEAYQDAARNWEGDFYFVASAGHGLPKDVYLYMDLWHGKCRDAYEVPDHTSKSPEFTIKAPLPAWRKVIEKQLDPIQGLMTRQLKLEGNMLKVMKSVKAAKELVNCCTLVETSWPK
jgi:putative sterol carrier protein